MLKQRDQSVKVGLTGYRASTAEFEAFERMVIDLQKEDTNNKLIPRQCLIVKAEAVEDRNGLGKRGC